MNKIKSIFVSILLIVSILAILNPVSAATLEVGPGKTYTTIGAAIAAANNGDTITVYPATYNENIVIDKSLTIQGIDKTTTKIRGTAGEIKTVSIKASNVVLKNLTIYNDQRPSDPNPSSAIFLVEIGYHGVSNITLENNIIGPQMAADGTSGGGMAVAIGGVTVPTTNITIKNNEIRDIKGNGCGIFIWAAKAKNGGGVGYNGLVQNVLIENNYIHDIRRTGIESAGNVKDITIKNNTIKNCGGMFIGDVHPKYGNGIALFKNGTYEVNAPGEDSERRNILISNNVIQNVSNIGVYLFGSSHDVTIEYNRLTQINKYGIMLDSLAGSDTPDPSQPLPSLKYKQKDDAFSNIKLIRNIFVANGKNIEIRTTYTPVIVNTLEGSIEKIAKVLGLGKPKPTGEIIEED